MHRPKKNWNEVFSTINEKTHEFHMIKSNKEVTLNAQETYFFYRKPQKLKISKKMFFGNYFRKKLSKTFSLLGTSHIAEETKSGQLSQK